MPIVEFLAQVWRDDGVDEEEGGGHDHDNYFFEER